MLREVTESYVAGRISLQNGQDSGPAETPGSIYNEAHKAAVPESGKKYYEYQDAKGNHATKPVHGGATVYCNQIQGKNINIIYTEKHQ